MRHALLHQVSHGTTSCHPTLKEYRNLARESEIQSHGVKLNKWQCRSLKRKLLETLIVVNEIVGSSQLSGREPVLRVLDRTVAGAKALIHKCCTQEWLQEAIKVAGSEELFIKYHVELEWYVALLRVASAVQDRHERVEQLKRFDWDASVDVIRSSIKKEARRDREEFLKLLEERISTSPNSPNPECNLARFLLLKFQDGCSQGTSGERMLVVEDPQNLGIQEAGSHIGSGGFAEVYENDWMGEKYCRKVFTRDRGGYSYKKESEMLAALFHPNIVSMVCSFVDTKGKGCILMELLSEDLDKFLERETSNAAPGAAPFELSKAVDIMLQIGEGSNFLHKKNLSHRDLKSSNILVNNESDLVVKIGDLGLAKLKETNASQSFQTPNVGTTRWRAPELFGQGRADARKADVWSFALICAHILTGKQPFEGVDNCGMYNEITKRRTRPNLPSTVPGGLVKLLQACWEIDPSKRPSFSYICRYLRLLKGIVLIGGDGSESCPMPPQFPSPQSAKACRPFLDSADSRSPTTSDATRFLVVGNSKAGKTTLVQKVCDPNPVSHTMGLEEYKHPSLPLYLYDSRGLDDKKQMDVIDKFLKMRNNSWTIPSVIRRWHVALRPWCSRDEDPLSSGRIHGIWFVYANSETPGIEWARFMGRIKKYNLPLQIMVTHFPGQDPDGDKLKENFLVKRHHLQCPRKEQIITFDLKMSRNDMLTADNLASEAREYLQNPDNEGIWYASQVTRTTLEIKLAARIISELRMELGWNGFFISQAFFRDAPKSYSYTVSALFIFRFYCRLWDVPQSLQLALAKKVIGMDSFADRDCDGNFELKPGTFLLFSLKVAAVILFMRIVQYPTGWTTVNAGYEANIDKCCIYLDTKLENLFNSRALEQEAPKLYVFKKQASKKLRRHLETVFEKCLQAIRADNDVSARMSYRCPSGSLCSFSSSFNEADYSPRSSISSEQSSAPPSRPSGSPGRSILEMQILPIVFLLIASSFLTSL